MKKKIIGVSVVIALLAILYVQSAVAQVSDVHLYVWTDKPQYKPGEKGTLRISVLNNRTDDPIEIKNITIEYAWKSYDAENGEWVGNETLVLDPAEILASGGGDASNYYKEVDFTVPSDGRAAFGDWAQISIWTNKGEMGDWVPLPIVEVSQRGSIEGFDTWMTSLVAAVVVCTIILALVVFLATRGTRTPRFMAPPPPSPKAKAA